MTATVEAALRSMRAAEVRAAETDMLRRCIAVIEDMHDDAIEDAHKEAFWLALATLRGMQER